MATITINRGEDVRIPFSITDATNSLLGMRVSWVVGSAEPRVPTRLLQKQSGQGISSTDVTITTMTTGEIAGTVNLTSEDFNSLPDTAGPFEASLWVDDGLSLSTCVTPGAVDQLVILDPVQPNPLV